MQNTLKTHAAGHPATVAWELVNELGLNGLVSIGKAEMLRFSLVDAAGYTVATPAEAVCLFDALLGKAFLPQTDSDWLDQLMTRFRVGAQWRPDINAWSATAAPNATGYGQTPGFAVVEALVAACRIGNIPSAILL